MFHAFQNTQGETRHADELTLLAYPRILQNCLLKHEENRYLVKAYKEKSAANLEHFVMLRRAREAIIGIDALRQEMLSETKEGMAEFAGIMALRQICEQKFAESVQKHLDKLLCPEILLKPRHMSYSAGCIMCLTMEALGINFYHALTETRNVFELVPQKMSLVEEHFIKHSQELNEQFSNFHKNHSKKTECDVVIQGFNPMAMVRVGNEIICDGVVLSGKYIDKLVLLILEEGSKNKVKAYLT